MKKFRENKKRSYVFNGSWDNSDEAAWSYDDHEVTWKGQGIENIAPQTWRFSGEEEHLSKIYTA